MEKRVLFCAFAEAPGPSAVGNRTAQLASIFPEAGFIVDGLTLKQTTLAHIERLGTARMLRVATGTDGVLAAFSKYSRAMGRQLASEPYDLIVAMDMVAAAAVLDHKGYAGKLVVDGAGSLRTALRQAGGDDDDFITVGATFRENEIFERADALVVATRSHARALGARADSRRINIVPRAVVQQVFRPPRAMGAEVAIFGTRSKREVEATLAAAGAIKAAVPTALLSLVGTEAPSAAHEAALRAYPGVKRRISANPKEVRRALARAKVVVVLAPQSRGVVPHRALEAMAMGRVTVLMAPDDSAAGTFVPGEEAFLVSPGEPGAVVAEVRRALDDPATFTAVADRGHKRCDTQCSIEIVADKFAAVLTPLLGVPLQPTMHETTPEGYTQSRTGVKPAPLSDSAPMPRAPRSTKEGGPPIQDPSSPWSLSLPDATAAAVLQRTDAPRGSSSSAPDGAPLPPDTMATTVAPMDVDAIRGHSEGVSRDIWAETVIDPQAPARERVTPSTVQTPPEGQTLGLPSTLKPHDRSSAAPWPAVLGDKARAALSGRPAADAAPDDDWAPDTVFDQRPLFADGDRGANLDSEAASHSGPVPRSDPARKSTDDEREINGGDGATLPFRAATRRFLVEKSAEGGPTAEQSRLPVSSDPSS